MELSIQPFAIRPSRFIYVLLMFPRIFSTAGEEEGFGILGSLRKLENRVQKRTSKFYRHFGKRMEKEKFNMAKEDYPPVNPNFVPIKGKVQFLTEIEGLNKDLQLLLEFSWAVQNGPGTFQPNLMNRTIGHVHKARWHNNCTSILKQYVTSSKPSLKLIKLCTIILNWYVPFLQYIREH